MLFLYFPTGLRRLRNISLKRSETCFNPLNLIFGRIFGIRPERGRDGRTGRTGRTDGRTDGTDGRADGRADGRDGRTGRTDGIQFYSTTGTEK